MEYRDTLHLPKTDFPMRGNLKVREPERLEKWQKAKAYEKLRELRKNQSKKTLHDGPPYSNGHIHMGTAVNKIVKDFIVRGFSMMGYDSPYVPGWDNHGMPIENNVIKELGDKINDTSIVEIRQLCREHAKKYIDIQRDEFIRLGGWGDWYDPYLTMSQSFEAKIVHVFGELVDKGYIYRGLKPILWSISKNAETALAEAEVEYKEKESDSIVVRFPLMNDPNGVFAGVNPGKAYVLIWTTTPWTIPANLAVVVHEQFDYSLIETPDGDVYLVASELIDQVAKMIEQPEVKVVKEMKGRELEKLVFKHPIFDRASPLFFGDHVTLEDGTGIVHTAPGHGAEDFAVGKREGLPILCPVNEKGMFTDEAGKYAGIHIYKGNKVVIEDMKENGTLLYHGKVRHSYPHDWRTKEPVIFRTTTQWFMSIDNADLRKRAIEAINETRWIPKATINRITSMVENRPDWCLSRQRSWGVGIPVFHCDDCAEIIMSKETVGYVEKLVAEKGSDAWFEAPANEILPGDYKCPKCSGQNFRKETDILDVWFDSGSTHRAVMEDRPELEWPCDVYFEGSDQHRGWFNSSLMIAVATKDAAPYRQVITHGWLLDGKGKAMHKSAGNVVSPLDVIDRYGADLLRLWTASTDYRGDMSFSDSNMKRVSDAYRRIRNTIRFALGNLADFDPKTHMVDKADMPEMDRWMMHRVQKFVERITKHYHDYDYHEVYQGVHNFCALDLSALYLDIAKDRLYCDSTDSVSRRSAQTAIYLAARALLGFVAPVLAFTAEEAWDYLPKLEGDLESIHFTEFPKVDTNFVDEALDARWTELLAVRQEVTKVLETARSTKAIGHSLDAAVYLAPKTDTVRQLLTDYRDILPLFFITSQVDLVEADEAPASDFQLDAETVKVTVKSARGEKCERCWQYSETVGTFEDHPTICQRCYQVVTEDS